MAFVVKPAAVASADAYADVAGTKIDTLRDVEGARSVAYVCSPATNGVTYKLVGSNDDSTYKDVKSVDEHGTQAAAADVAVAAAGSAVLATPTTAAGFRFYKIQHKSTTAGSSGTSTVVGFAK